MSNNKYMNITIGEKTYKYYFFQVNTPNNQPPYSSPTSNPKAITKNLQFKQYESDIIPLFSFLELPRSITSLSAEIDGKSVSIQVKQVSGRDYYYADFIAGNVTFRAYEPSETTNAANATSQGTAFGYNYATKQFLKFSGGTSFVITERDEDTIFRLYFDNDFFNHYSLPTYNYLSEVPVGTHFCAKYYPANWQTADFKYYSDFDAFQKGNNYKPIEYPDSPDNDDEPDDSVTGDGDTDSEPIPEPPPMPISDVTDTGFVVIYNPNAIEIRQLAYFMWTTDFSNLIKKVLGNPFDALISLKLLYCPVLKSAAKLTVWLGNVETDVSMYKVVQQFTDVDLGSIKITEFFGSFADYAPFTKIQIFLPFIGYKDLNTDEVMNATLHLRYRIDVYSGACIAFLTVTKTIKSTVLNSILYQFDGNCAMEIPFTASDNSRYVSAILNSAASSALSLANTSSFSPPQIAQGFSKGESAKFELGSLAPVANGLMDIMSVKPNVQRAGSLAGAVASMGVKQPYVIIHRPIAQMPTNYQHYYGIPLNLNRKLSQVTGYTVVSQVFITSAVATDEEITMITELLKNGVIL